MVPLVSRDPADPTDPMVLLENKEPLEHVEWVDLMDLMDWMDPRDHREPRDQEEMMAEQDHKDALEWPVDLDHKESKEPWDNVAAEANKAQQDHLDPEEMMAQQDAWEQWDHLAHAVRPVTKVYKEARDTMPCPDHQVLPERREPTVAKENVEDQEWSDPEAQTETTADQETQDPADPVDSTETAEAVAHVVALDPKVCPDHQVEPDHQDPPRCQATHSTHPRQRPTRGAAAAMHTHTNTGTWQRERRSRMDVFVLPSRSCRLSSSRCWHHRAQSRTPPVPARTSSSVIHTWKAACTGLILMRAHLMTNSRSTVTRRQRKPASAQPQQQSTMAHGTQVIEDTCSLVIWMMVLSSHTQSTQYS